MAQLGKADYEAKYNHASTGLFKTNSSNDIGSDDLRAFVEDTADSMSLNHFRGAYDASGNTYPASGGSGTSGVIHAGDHWYMSVIDSGLAGGPWVVGTILLALIDTPGQTAGNWRIF